MSILAMTQLTSWLGLACFAICLALIVHAVNPYSGRNPERVNLRLWSLLWRAALECVCLFIWLACGLPLLAWGLWIGDNEHWFYNFAWVFAAGIAIGVSSVSTTPWIHFRSLQIL